MIVFISGEEYDANVNAITAVRYRARYGKSVFEISNDEEKINLLRVALSVEEPGANALPAAEVVFRNVVRGDRALQLPEKSAGTESKEPYDEFDILAVAMNSSMFYEVLNDLSLFQVFAVINKALEMKNGAGKQKENTYGEYLTHYDISEDQVAEIQRYMAEHPEEAD